MLAAVLLWRAATQAPTESYLERVMSNQVELILMLYTSLQRGIRKANPKNAITGNKHAT